MASIRKRSWSYKGQQKESWIVDYFDLGGKRRQKTFDLKKTAETYRKKLQHELHTGEHVSGGEEITVRDLVEQFIHHSEVRMANKAIGRTRHNAISSIFKCYVIPYFGPRKFNELTGRDIEDWANSLRMRGRKDGSGLAAQSLNHALSLMKMLEDFATKRGASKRRIMGDARKEIGSLQGDPIRTFTLEEVQQLLSAIPKSARGSSPRDHHLMLCYVRIAAFCGLRLGEINGLKPECVDFDKHLIRVRHSLTRVGELKGPKTKAGVRDVPMPTIVADALYEWLRRYYAPNKTGVFFTTRTGCPLHRIDINNRWRRLLRNAGLASGRSLHFHALRHFAASWMIEHQLPLPDVARVLGHAKFDMTLQIYAHPVHSLSHHQPIFDRMAGAVMEGVALPAPSARSRVLEARFGEDEERRNAIRKRLVVEGISHGRLCQATGLNQTALSRYLSGQARLPDQFAPVLQVFVNEGFDAMIGKTPVAA